MTSFICVTAGQKELKNINYVKIYKTEFWLYFPLQFKKKIQAGKNFLLEMKILLFAASLLLVVVLTYGTVYFYLFFQ